MSKINDLIKELCPNGVEYKNIKDICVENFWVMPSTPKYQDNGVPYITSKNIRNGKVLFSDIKYITEDDYKIISSNRPIKENDFLISMIGTIGEVGIVKDTDLPFYGQNMYLLRLNIEVMNIRFFYHYFTSEKVRNKLLGEKNNGNQGYLRTKNIEMLNIPIPPIEVQEEIVRILDRFGELESELESELEARRSQYEFWRKNIFELNNEDFKSYELQEIFDMKNGYTPSTLNNEFWDNGKIPWFRMEDIRLNGGVLNDSIQHITPAALKNSGTFKANSIICATSATIGVHALIECDFLSNQRFTCLTLKEEFKDEIYMKYIYYYCFILDEYCKNNLNQGSFSSVDMNMFKKFKFKIPSIEVQKKIINILDKFDKLVNDISVGLPAEIESRRKQYEYYRNKLLSFEEQEYE